MEVFIIKKNKREKLVNEEVAYSSFTPNNNQNLSNFKCIIKHEWETLIRILDSFYERSEWLTGDIFQTIDADHLPRYDYNNYIINILGDISAEDANKLFDISSDLLDVYEKDYEFLKNSELITNVIVLTFNKNYIGHVYLSESEEEMSIIGIRTSLIYIILKNRGLNLFKNVAYILLDAFRKYSIEKNASSISIENPIGPMIDIAEKYGFEENTFDLENEPLVDVPEFILHF